MGDQFEPDDYRGEQQEYLYELIGFRDDPTDQTMHDLFYEVMYNDELSYDDRLETYAQLTEYLMETYGLDFEDLWDWEEFREWYDVG